MRMLWIAAFLAGCVGQTSDTAKPLPKIDVQIRDDGSFYIPMKEGVSEAVTLAAAVSHCGAKPAEFTEARIYFASGVHISMMEGRC